MKRSIFVPAGNLLYIDPGVTLRMGAETSITVRGRIYAGGTRDKPIIFVGDGAPWRGIQLIGEQRSPLWEKIPRNDRKWLSKGAPGTLPLRELTSVDTYLPGDFEERLREGHVFRHCTFERLRSGRSTGTCSRLRKRDVWRNPTFNLNMRYVVEVYRTSVTISNSAFKEIRCVGGVLLRQAYGALFDNLMGQDFVHKNVGTSVAALVYDGNTIREARDKCG